MYLLFGSSDMVIVGGECNIFVDLNHRFSEKGNGLVFQDMGHLIIKMHVLFPVHFLVTSNIFVPIFL